MLNLVWERRPTYNNTASVSKSKCFTYLKLIYYIFFAIAYGIVGSLADIILVNSSWTFNHISYLWRFQRLFAWIYRSSRSKLANLFRKNGNIHVMYLPCGIDIANSIENDSPQQRENYIVSIGQFRPEKDHAKQIKSFAMFLSKQDQNIGIVKLILIGSCRNDADYDRVKVLRELAFDKLKLPKSQVEFVINEKYSTLHKYMTKSLIGLHTMWNEHFGISVVEMMSNGLITIGHNSGGPKCDIISVPSSNCNQFVQRTGYLAHTEEEYVNAFQDIFNLTPTEKQDIRKAAKISCHRFSDEVFMHEFKHLILEATQ